MPKLGLSVGLVGLAMDLVPSLPSPWKGLFVLFYLVALVTGSNYQTCKSIVQASEAGQSAILCIGKLDDSILLITVDLWVFKFPEKSLDLTSNHWWFDSTIRPTAMQHMWPRMFMTGSPVTNITGCFFTEDDFAKFMLKVSFQENSWSGFTFDITHNKIKTGFNSSIPFVPISSLYINREDKPKFYLVQNYAASLDTVRVMQFVFESYDVWGSSTVKVDDSSKMYSICMLDTGNITVQLFYSTTQQCNHIKGSVSFGFNDRDNFYLFLSDTSVLLFPREAFDHLSEPFPFKRYSLADFIICSSKEEYEAAHSTGPSRTEAESRLLGIAILVLVILFVLLSSLCLLWVIFCDHNEMAIIPKTKDTHFRVVSGSKVKVNATKRQIKVCK